MKQTQTVLIIIFLVIAAWLCLIVQPSERRAIFPEKASTIEVQSANTKTSSVVRNEIRKPFDPRELFDFLTNKERRVIQSLEKGMTLEEFERKILAVGKLSKVSHLGGSGAQDRIYKVGKRTLRFSFEGIEPQKLSDHQNEYSRK